MRIGNSKPDNNVDYNSISVIRKSWSLFDNQDRRKLTYIAGVQILLSALDLLGVILIGLISALTLNAITVGSPGERLARFLSIIQIDNLNPQTQAVLLGLSACAILIAKTMLSLRLTKRALIFLNVKAAHLSDTLTKKFLNQPLQNIQQRTMYQSLYDLTTGVQAIGNGIVATTISIVADFALIIVLLIALLFVDPIVALGSIVIFTITGLVLFKSIQHRASIIGEKGAVLAVQNNNSIIEVFEGFKEAVVRNRRGYYANRIGNERIELAELNAESTFLPQISKYVLEIAMVVSGLLISGLQFLTNDAYRAIGVMSIFLAASSRMGPAVLRIQQSALTFKTSVGMAKPSLLMIAELEGVHVLDASNVDMVQEVDLEHQDFEPVIQVMNLTVNHFGKSDPAISGLNMVIKPGTTVAIVGLSGAGKSTLVDCMLGILEPSSGEVLISGRKPLDSINRWPGAIGYVPQKVFIANGTVLENVALGFNPLQVSEDRVRECLAKVKLLDFVESLPHGLATELGDFGSRLSGGQRQRLGIARALYTNPKLLILDEATSSLDGQTEKDVSRAIEELGGGVTVILVAHRLSIVRSASQIHYLSAGVLEYSGSFEEVRAEVPDFDRQAKLMGL